MAVGLSSSARACLVIVNQVLAARPKWSYLDPSWILTIIDIESGYRPLAGPNSANRFDGLMQVIPTTALQMSMKYGIPVGPQTDPTTSVTSGTAYLDASARDIIAKRGAKSVDLWEVAQAYNEGFAAIEAGKLDPAYLQKFELNLPIVQAQMHATSMMTLNVAMNFRPAWNMVPT
jgi:soluble lytic murein transglycosylase-like protein